MMLGTAAVAVAASVSLLGHGLYQSYLGRLLTEVREESSGGVKGAGMVLVRKLGVVNRRFMTPAYEARVRRSLVKGGDPQAYKPEDILALQELSAVVGLFAGLILVNGVGQSLGWSVLFLLLGAYYPLLWVSDQVKKRHLLIGRALPYSLDLLTLSVEAGLDFTGALAKVVEKGKDGPLKEELQLVLKQLKMGKTREEALKSMIARVDLPALTTFVTALIQADKMGTSLGKVLRIQSTQMRIDRTQRAEKLAGEAPVKMLFPLIACIFPTVFMVLFGPIVFKMLFGQME
ncbi:type II secretion system F family protein [Aggregicoccus sp. 17bor-14]|nr:type II secretion system F family protein [Simulacricoccus sp. 17bor-14]MRI91295.1 type II secretion system F family protein [Aggregicoccus sp. 17bor-14]